MHGIVRPKIYSTVSLLFFKGKWLLGSLHELLQTSRRKFKDNHITNPFNLDTQLQAGCIIQSIY